MINLSKYNTETACNTPQGMKLKNPFNGALIMGEDGKPFEILMLGIKSTAARNAFAEKARSESKDEGEAAAAKRGAEFLAKLTAGWDGEIEVLENGKAVKLKYSFDNAVRLYLCEDWVAAQAQAFAFNVSNFDPLEVSA